jgi:hypothetical protein
MVGYKIIQLTHQNKYIRALFFLKTYVICIRNCCLNKLFKIFNIFCLMTTHNFVKIYIITPNYAH